MKKLILLFLVFVLKFAPAKAQWVTIPDPNFVTKLTQLFPSCMNGNQMDTTCAEIVNEDSLDITSSSITSISGIEYFDNLIWLHCQYNQISNINSFPPSLLFLNCNYNNLSNLPPLPDSLIELSCSFNNLTNFPTLPSSLQKLVFWYNQFSVPPTLPSSLIEFDCSHNLLTNLPELPNSLLNITCFYNQITSLPNLPSNLESLRCNANDLVNLPILPTTIKLLHCNDNLLTELPTLPDSLKYFRCNTNMLSILPELPISLLELRCSNNQLINIPITPNQMQIFEIDNNNVSCLANLPTVQFGGNISNNPISCVPNQTNYSLGLPLCMENDSLNNPNNCPSVAITGYIYTDFDTNCMFNNLDHLIENIPVKLFDNQNNFVAQSNSVNGIYSFSMLQPDTYSIRIDVNNLPIEISCGQLNYQSVSLDSANQTILGINFPVNCDVEYDINVQSVTKQGWVSPGQVHTLKTTIGNNESWFNIDCDEGNTSGMVNISITGPVSFVAPAAGALTPTVNGNTFNYTISNFNNLSINSFGLQLMTDTTAQANDQICVHVEISPNPMDADTTNNVYDFCYNVVNSYDPNMKEVYPINVLPGYDDWFTYTIHFQNTGNAPAFNIRLRDTLDNQLDLNTFEVLGYSHPANVTVSGNILTVRFNNIMLPDSTSDYEGSMGYFQYRIKPFPNLPLGSQISNTAYIYFDYNAPIITNTTENNFEFPVSVSSIASSENKYSVYPNPSTGIFTFKDAKAIQRVEVYNVMGQEIAVFAGDNTNKVSKQINLSNYSKGIYFAKINGSVVIKLVKE